METTQRRHIADTIRAARLRKGWTVTEAARHLHTGESNWSRWETAHATPRPGTLVAIGELLDLPDDWMVPTTQRHPSPTVDPDELLDRIRDELTAHERRIEQLLEKMTGGSGDAEPGDHDQLLGERQAERREQRDDARRRRPPAP